MLHHKAWQIPTNNTLSHYSFSSDEDSIDDRDLGEECTTDDSYYSEDTTSDSVSGCVAPEIKDVTIDIHPSITITCSTPPPPSATSPNEVFLSLVSTPLEYEHVPLPPDTTPAVSMELPLTDTVLRPDPGIALDSIVNFDRAETPDSDSTSDHAMTPDSALMPDHTSILDSSPALKSTSDNTEATDFALNRSTGTDLLSASHNSSVLETSFNGTDSGTISLSPLPSRRHFSEHKNPRRLSTPSPEPDAITGGGGGLPRVGSWMNLRGPLVEMMTFSRSYSNANDSSGSGEQDAVRKEPEIRSSPTTTTTPTSAGSVVRSVPWSAVSSLQ